MPGRAAYEKRLRGVILSLVKQQHARQDHRHTDYTLMDTLKTLSYGVHLNLVRELVQDLIERGYLAGVQHQSDLTGETSIEKITITPAGRDLLARRRVDDAVGIDVDE